MDMLEPTFGDTKSYQQIRDFSDTIVSVLRFLSKLTFGKSGVNSAVENEALAYGEERKSNANDLNTAMVAVPEELDDASIDVFNV